MSNNITVSVHVCLYCTYRVNRLFVFLRTDIYEVAKLATKSFVPTVHRVSVGLTQACPNYIMRLKYKLVVYIIV